MSRSSLYITPDEIIAVLRRRTSARVIHSPPRYPDAPAVTTTNENMYGVLLYIYGEGVKGQYIKHSYIDREGQRWWVIEYGWVTVWGRLRDNTYIPLVVLGVPTRLAFEYYRDVVEYIIEEVPIGYMECLERHMINLDRVMRGEDLVLIIDRYELLGEKLAPSEVIDRIREQQQLIEALQRALWEFEKRINDYRTNIAILQAENAKLKELLLSYSERLLKLTVEVTSIQQELIRLREEVYVRAVEAEALEETRKNLRNVIDQLMDISREFTELISAAKAVLETARAAAPAPVTRKEEEESEEEEEKKEKRGE